MGNWATTKADFTMMMLVSNRYRMALSHDDIIHQDHMDIGEP